VAGTWWPAEYRGEPLLSLDAEVAAALGLGLGDRLGVNILGRTVEGRIASLRRVEWRTLAINFVIVFSPGLLENAPQTHLATIYADAGADLAIERAVVERFPNVSAIRVKEALDAVNAIVADIGLAVRLTAAFALLAGTLVLGGAIAAGHRRRVYDAVVLKVLGARRRTVLGSFLVEYGLLGLITALIAAALGIVAAVAVLAWVMEFDWVVLGVARHRRDRADRRSASAPGARSARRAAAAQRVVRPRREQDRAQDRCRPPSPRWRRRFWAATERFQIDPDHFSVVSWSCISFPARPRHVPQRWPSSSTRTPRRCATSAEIDADARHQPSRARSSSARRRLPTPRVPKIVFVGTAVSAGINRARVTGDLT
jgi:hypothetical protein